MHDDGVKIYLYIIFWTPSNHSLIVFRICVSIVPGWTFIYWLLLNHWLTSYFLSICFLYTDSVFDKEIILSSTTRQYRLGKSYFKKPGTMKDNITELQPWSEFLSSVEMVWLKSSFEKHVLFDISWVQTIMPRYQWRDGLRRCSKNEEENRKALRVK
jgi:hypothetical protein